MFLNEVVHHGVYRCAAIKCMGIVLMHHSKLKPRSGVAQTVQLCSTTSGVMLHNQSSCASQHNK